MKIVWTITLVCFALVTVNAQQKPQATPQTADAQVLEGMIRKAWDDYKSKNKEAFARIFTEDAVEVEEGSDGAHDKQATLAEMDEADLLSVALGDFHYRPIGATGMLVRYSVDYTAKFKNETIHNHSIIGEVWEKTGGDWKIFYFQETKIK